MGTYTYNAHVDGNPSYRLIPHAVAQAGGNTYQYDANGNMTVRTEVSGTASVSYAQAWTIDNRLAIVTNTTSGDVTRMFYDADGNRVLKIAPTGAT